MAYIDALWHEGIVHARCKIMNAAFSKAMTSARAVLDNEPCASERRLLGKALRALDKATRLQLAEHKLMEAEAARLAKITKSAAAIHTQTIRMKDICHGVCERHHISLDDLRSESRHRVLVYARHEAMYLASILTLLSTTQMGKYLNRDHSTVVVGIQAHKRRMEAAGP